MEQKQMMINLFNLSTEEQAALAQLAVDIGAIKADNVLTAMDETKRIMDVVRNFIAKNTALSSRIIRIINKNPDAVKQINPDIFEALKKRCPVHNTDYYVPPIAGVDPMDITIEALPAALAVALVTCALMFVGRGGLRGVV